MPKRLEIMPIDEEELIAKRHFREILDRAPWISSMIDRSRRIASEAAGAKSKYRKLVVLANELGDAVSPSAVCRRGCSSCCYKPVTISSLEAELIGEALDRRPDSVDSVGDRGKEMQGEVGACPMLVEGECSVYSVRPLACRTSFNIGSNPAYCDVSVAPEGFTPYSVNTDALWMAYSTLFKASGLADIRQFFPTVSDSDSDK